MEPTVISALDYTVYSEKFYKSVAGQEVKSNLLQSKGVEIHAAPQSYFVYVDNTSNNLLYTYGMGPCHTLIIYIDDGPALLGHIDTDSLLCPVFMTQKLLEMIRKHGSEPIKIVYIEPATKGKKRRFSHILSYNYLKYLKRKAGYKYTMWRYIIPASEEIPINLVALENNRVYILGKSPVSNKLIRLSTVMQHWEIVSCPAGKQTFKDDLLWSCPVKDRFTRGVKGTDTFGMNLSEIVEYVMENIDVSRQNKIFSRYFNDIKVVLLSLVSYNSTRDDSEQQFTKLTRAVIVKIDTQLEKTITAQDILKIFCKWFAMEKNRGNHDKVRLVAKFIEEIYLHSFVNIINVAAG